MFYANTPPGPPGPKKAVSLLHLVIDIEADPKPIKDWLSELILLEKWETVETIAYEKAEKWSPIVLNFIKQAIEHQDIFGRPDVFTINSSSDYLIQGAAYIEGNETPKSQEHKKRRKNIFRAFELIKNLTDQNFENLCTKILILLGATTSFTTKKSGDEGIDFFGYLKLDKYIFPIDIAPTLQRQLNIWLVGQAKHYQKIQVATPDIRELVGSVELARHKAFSKHDSYPDLNILPCDPIFRLFFTTGNISSDGWSLLENSGVIGMDGLMVSAFLCDREVGFEGKDINSILFKKWIEQKT